MKFIKLTEKNQFEELKRGDLIIVEWSNYYVEHVQGVKKIMSYNIYENKKICNEIICQRRYNHYFNYNMYLNGESNALEVYKVVE